MEKLLWFFLIMISFSQAFGHEGRSYYKDSFPRGEWWELNILHKESRTRIRYVCLHIYTALSSIFSYATKKSSNDILIFWDKDKGYTFGVSGPEVLFTVSEIPEAPTHICASWESATGIVEFWVDGKPKVRKSLHKGYKVGTDASIILGQEQDSYGGSFDAKQSLVGDIGDVNMWDFVLSPEQTNTVYVGGTLSPNVLNWRALKYKAQGDVFIKPQLWS